MPPSKTMNNWNEYVNKIGDLVSFRENYQRQLGELASVIAKEFGPHALKELAADVSETFGIRIGVSTLRNYRWVYEQTKDLELPEDLSYRTLQSIASSGNPEVWAKRIIDEGLSSAEAYKLMREEKGVSPKKTYICDNCGAENEL